MVIINKYKKIITDNAIYIKLFFDVSVSYLTVSIDDVLNNNNNETVFTEFRRFLKKLLRLKCNKVLSLNT